MVTVNYYFYCYNANINEPTIPVISKYLLTEIQNNKLFGF